MQLTLERWRWLPVGYNSFAHRRNMSEFVCAPTMSTSISP